MKCINATKFHRKSGGAQWRDLLFLIRTIEFEWMHHPPLCHPDRSVAEWRDLQCARRRSRIPRLKPQPSNRSVIPTEAKRSGGTCCSSSALSNLNG